MSNRNGYQHGVPCQVTTMQPDPDAAAAFYQALFGWELRPELGGFVALLRGREAARITPLPPMMAEQPAAGWVTNVQVDDPAATGAAATDAGGAVIAGPMDLPSGALVVLRDPTGGVVAAWRPRGLTGAEVVNEPGAWAMSQLTSADPERAARFYAQVFGWTTEAFGDATMFRLPGYEGGEPEQPVSREVVATMIAGEPAGWTPDFWVADLDATLQSTSDHGGRVLAGPYPSPVGRGAALADPAGAVFTVSALERA